MANFNEAIKTILAHEGGLVNNSNDPGGITNFGVSLRFLKSTGQLDYDFDGDGSIDTDDIKCITVADASKIYKDQWWDKYGYERIKSDAIASKLFDMSINMGQQQAVKLVQSACKLLSPTADLIIDGILGNKTADVINSLNSDELLRVIRDDQATFYKALIKRNPKLAVFEKGWMSRAYA